VTTGVSSPDTSKALHGRRPIRAAAGLAPLGILLLLGTAALWAAREIAVPVLAALFIGSMVGPLVERLEARGVAPGVSALALLAVVLGGLYVAFLALVDPVTEWISRGPELGGLLQQRLRILERPLAAIHQVTQAIAALEPGAAPVTVGVRSQSLLQTIIGVLTPAVGELVVFFGTLVFYVADRRSLKQKVAALFRSRESRLEALHVFTEVEENLRTYLSVVTVINLGLGIATALMTWLVGLPNFYLWGVLAFVLNYAPYIGPTIMAGVLAIAALVTFDSFGHALLPPALFVIMATLEGHGLTPSIVGRRLTLRPFLVFLALAFWTWLWGPAGTLLATPLLIVGLVVGRHLFPPDEAPLPG
jgi:predicted PurR-regulated permease PerM